MLYIHSIADKVPSAFDQTVLEVLTSWIIAFMYFTIVTLTESGEYN